MKRFLGGLLMAVTLLAMPVAASAQTAQGEGAERLALANKFVVLMQGDQLASSMGQMMSVLGPPPNSNMTAEEREIFNDVTNDMVAVMLPRIFEAMAPIYADIFTLEELRGLVAFYESEIGQSLITKSYAASPRIAAVVQGIMPGVMSEMGDRLCDRLSCSADERSAMKTAMAQAFPAER
ncbi:MAG: DUF2059 domain-containing protein [Brevundimonas sp.]|nr:DUF2059 domain-containing protein [Brevundimonas sp.]